MTLTNAIISVTMHISIQTKTLLITQIVHFPNLKTHIPQGISLKYYKSRRFFMAHKELPPQILLT